MPTTDNFDEVSMVSSNLYNIPPDELRKTPQLSRTNTESSQTFHRSHWTIGNPLTRRPLVKSRKSSKNSNISEISRKSHDFGMLQTVGTCLWKSLFLYGQHFDFNICFLCPNKHSSMYRQTNGAKQAS